MGWLITWHTLTDRHDAVVRNLIAQGWRNQGLVDRLKELPMVDDAFEAFCSFVQSVKDEAGHSWWAACMELCMNSDYAARIHLHAFMCVEPARLHHSPPGEAPEIMMEKLVYEGQSPHVRPVCLIGRRRGMWEAAFAGGMYYVLAEKEASLRHRGNKALFQDMFAHQKSNNQHSFCCQKIQVKNLSCYFMF